MKSRLAVGLNYTPPIAERWLEHHDKAGFYRGPHFLIGLRSGLWGGRGGDSFLFQYFPDSLYVMGAHIVHYNNVSSMQGRQKRLSQVSDKPFSCRASLVSSERFLAIATD